jgi:hypothetical protein
LNNRAQNIVTNGGVTNGGVTNGGAINRAPTTDTIGGFAGEKNEYLRAVAGILQLIFIIGNPKKITKFAASYLRKCSAKRKTVTSTAEKSRLLPFIQMVIF